MPEEETLAQTYLRRCHEILRHIERVEGLGQVILRNFEFGARDLMMVFSTSGTGAVSVDVALEAKRLGMPVIAVTSLAHSRASKPGHSSGKRLCEVADLTLDNGA